MIDFKTLTDEGLVSNVKLNINAEPSLNELIERHSGICITIINSYMSKNSNANLREEIMKEKDFLIYQAAVKFKLSKKAKFSTYLGNEVKWKCLNCYNKHKRDRTVSLENGLIDYFATKTENETSSNTTDVFNEIITFTNSHPDKRVKKIFYLRYVVGKNNSVMPWKNISNELGMSIQGCINIHNSAIKNLKHRIK
jgi:DNA-directed RNA polymerase specialized sigma subunit